jgi:hypothetical protein
LASDLYFPEVSDMFQNVLRYKSLRRRECIFCGIIDTPEANSVAALTPQRIFCGIINTAVPNSEASASLRSEAPIHAFNWKYLKILTDTTVSLML